MRHRLQSALGLVMLTCVAAVAWSVAPVAAGASGRQAQTPGPGIPADRRPEARAFIELLAKHDFAAAAARFDDTMAKLMPAAKLEELWKGLEGAHGAFKGFGGARKDRAGAYDRAIITVVFEKWALDMMVVFNRTGQVAGLFAQPAWTLPAYADLKLYREEEVQVGTGGNALPGTLTMPVDCAGCPGLVLVHGSGPNDRDESLGPNKFFRDLAVGLASRGIAVLRYDKRSYASPASLASVKAMTVKEEVIDDALAALDALRSTKGVDAAKVFVAGHSLGAGLAPRIAKDDQKLAGAVMLAAPARPLEDHFVEQQAYILSLAPKTAQQDAETAKLKAQVDRIKKLTDADRSSSENLLGAPPAYWLDLRANPPVEIAKGLPLPLLILQGERDYQVTIDDFKLWQDALGSRPNVTLRSYPELNHLFVAGTGKSKPQEYSVPGHADVRVIDGIAAWIKKQ